MIDDIVNDALRFIRITENKYVDVISDKRLFHDGSYVEDLIDFILSPKNKYRFIKEEYTITYKYGIKNKKHVLTLIFKINVNKYGVYFDDYNFKDMMKSAIWRCCHCANYQEVGVEIGDAY